MKLHLVLLLMSATTIFCSPKLYEEEISNFNEEEESLEDAIEGEGESDEMEVENKVSDYLKNRLGKSNNEEDEGTANLLPILKEMLDNNDDQTDEEETYDTNEHEDEKPDDLNGGGVDGYSGPESPEIIDDKLDGKKIDDEGDIIVQGDIVMKKKEEDALFDLHEDDSKQRRSEVVMDVTKIYKYWPNGVVPYVIEGSLNGGWWLAHAVNARKAINAAIGEFNSRSCVRLVKRTNQKNYVSFFKGKGCYSQVGMKGGKQQISIGSGCQYKKTAVHEILHALGFWHEQSRPDRDSYVTIHWKNIESEDRKHNFAKMKSSEVESFGHPYDYRSVMHYSKKAFGKKNWIGSRAITITPKVSFFPDFGQCKSCGMSTTDAAQLVRLYCSKPQNKVPSYAALSNELKYMMGAFKDQKNDVFAKTLKAHLRRKYPNYYWTVSAYNAVGGYARHAFRGYCGHVWRHFNKNVVACYSKKTTKVPSAAKRSQIAAAALAAAKGGKCNAKSAMDRAWKKANSYGYRIALAHNVRHGSGLRTTWYAHTNFVNYQCDRTCGRNFWLIKGKCTNHKSSLVIMFGGP